MRNQNKRLFLMAALLAGSSALDLDDVGDGESVGIRAEFAEADQTNKTEITTDRDFRVQIERVALESSELDVRPRDEDGLDRLLAQLERPTIDVTPGVSGEPVETELVLSNAHFQGRVFDEMGSRLPKEGLGISGNVPLNVKVRRTGDVSNPLDVRFEVPSHFFEGIDWSA